MDAAIVLSRQGGRLLQLGIALELYASFEGFVIPHLASQRIGLLNETIRLMGELPHGLARGTTAEETCIKVLAYSSAPTGLLAFGLMLSGLRGEQPSARNR